MGGVLGTWLLAGNASAEKLEVAKLNQNVRGGIVSI